MSKEKIVVDMYGEDLSDLCSKMHEVVEGRYKLDGYEEAYILAALYELLDLKANQTLNKEELNYLENTMKKTDYNWAHISSKIGLKTWIQKQMGYAKRD